ncbi:MAG: hypothetical protein ABI315_15700 [Bacteroidia bacterium]
MTNDDHTATEAVIYLKDGKRKYGMLMEKGMDQVKNFYRFISNDNLYLFNNTNNSKYIEILDRRLIEAIDIDLK